MFKQDYTYYDLDRRQFVFNSRRIKAETDIFMLIVPGYMGAAGKIPSKLLFKCRCVLSENTSDYSILKNTLGEHGRVKYPHMVFEHNYDAMWNINKPGSVLISPDVRNIDGIIDGFRNLYAFRKYYLLID